MKPCYHCEVNPMQKTHTSQGGWFNTQYNFVCPGCAIESGVRLTVDEAEFTWDKLQEKLGGQG